MTAGAPHAAVSGAVRSARRSRSRGVLALAVGLVVLFGVAVRLYHVGERVFWDDEVIATLHILGTTEGELVERASRFTSMGDLSAAVHPEPPLRGLEATIGALRAEDPQHPPLYYLGARLWAGAFGDSRVALRALSVVFGLAALPCMYWLCIELFGTAEAASLGVALVAVSPVDVLYAHEIREYSFWFVAIIVTSALYVRALRGGSLAAWLTYAGAFALSLYIFPASLLVGFAHALGVMFVPANRRDRLQAWGAFGLGCLLYAPWAVVIVAHAGQIHKGMATIEAAQGSRLGVLKTFAGVVRTDTFDMNGGQPLLAAFLTLPIVGLCVLAVLRLRNAAPLAVVLVLSLAACACIPIVGLDLLFGGQRTSAIRYFLPLYIALDLALAGAGAAALTAIGTSRRAARLWIAALAVILVARTGSCALAARAPTWWSEYDNGSMRVAAAIDAAERPIVVSDDYLVWALSLSEYAQPRVAVALSPRCYLCDVPPRPLPVLSSITRPGAYGTIFLLAPSRALQHAVKSALRDRADAPLYRCIDVRANCSGDLSLW